MMASRWLLAGLLVFTAACAASPSTTPMPFGENHGPQGDASGAASSSPNGAGSGGPSADDASGSATPEASTPDDAPAADDAAAASDAGGLPFPPIMFPDSGAGSPPPSGDGGANSCTSKLCVDPVFDCPLQGCFNGCTNFHCN